MSVKTKLKEPEIVYQKGKAVKVVIDINDYQEMLERLEDAEDLQELKKLRQKPLRFKKLDDFLAERKPNV